MEEREGREAKRQHGGNRQQIVDRPVRASGVTRSLSLVAPVHWRCWNGVRDDDRGPASACRRVRWRRYSVDFREYARFETWSKALPECVAIQWSGGLSAEVSCESRFERGIGAGVG
jgi:hypothetical protein